MIKLQPKKNKKKQFYLIFSYLVVIHSSASYGTEFSLKCSIFHAVWIIISNIIKYSLHVSKNFLITFPTKEEFLKSVNKCPNYSQKSDFIDKNHK